MDKEEKEKIIEEFVGNVVRERAELARLAGLQFGGDRDIDAVCGYTTDPSIADYKAKYDRRGIASTIVDAPAETTWRKHPIITDGSQGKSPFMKEWEELQKRLSVFHYMERVDRLTGLGRYGVILIGAKDGQLDQPLEGVSGASDIIFLSTFSEVYAKIKSFVTDVHDPRFGHPLTYEIDLAGDIGGDNSPGMQDVHYSRVIHVAERLLENEVFGEPRLQKVFNYLEDLDKIVGSSAEGFWQSAAKGLVLGNKTGYEFGDGITDAKEQVQEYIHGLQRVLALEGVDVQELKGFSEDPSKAFDIVLSLISGKTRIPKRVLIGSERGELASSQDEANWLGHISERQTQFAEPRILRAFIDRLIAIKALPAPQSGEYEVEWPGLFYLNDVEQADVYEKRAAAIKAVSGGFPLDMFTIPELREAIGFEAEPEKPNPTTQALDEENEEVQAEFGMIMEKHG